MICSKIVSEKILEKTWISKTCPFRGCFLQVRTSCPQRFFYCKVCLLFGDNCFFKLFFWKKKYTKKIIIKQYCHQKVTELCNKKTLWPFEILAPRIFHCMTPSPIRTHARVFEEPKVMSFGPPKSRSPQAKKTLGVSPPTKIIKLALIWASNRQKT